MRTLALAAWLETDPYAKATRVNAWESPAPLPRDIDPLSIIVALANIPGRPARPLLIDPRRVQRRSMQSMEGRAALIHALCHIEFNAINLALDAVWRFDGLPAAFYRDWIAVAAEEARHFLLFAAHLRTFGVEYGDFSAHDGLWQMADKTRHDVLARIALVPRTLEARGFGASPLVRAKLAGAGDRAGAAIIDAILADEIGHVAIGNRWYRWFCVRQRIDPIATYARLAGAYDAPIPKAPFNLKARRAAGFDETELAALGALTNIAGT